MINGFAAIIFVLCFVSAIIAAPVVENIDFTSTSEIPSLPYELENKVVDNVGFSRFDDNHTADDSYDLGASHVFATISSATYCGSSSSKSLENWDCQACKDSGISLTDITRLYVAKTDGRGIVGYNKEKNLIIVAYRGSSSLQNWITDLDFFAIDYKECSGCKVHGGFLKSYQLIRPQMVAAIAALLRKHPSASVTVTGHSLGAALAAHALVDLSTGVFTVSTLTGSDIVHTGLAEYDASEPLSAQQAIVLGATQTQIAFNMSKTAYTYGQPRIGNKAFSAFFRDQVKSRVFRLTHHHDPVPHLPPMSFGFEHPTQEVFWNKKSTSYTVCSANNGEDSNCSNRNPINIGVIDHLVYSGYKMTGNRC